MDVGILGEPRKKTEMRECVIARGVQRDQIRCKPFQVVRIGRKETEIIHAVSMAWSVEGSDEQCREKETFSAI
jgi:hypothetical protein